MPSIGGEAEERWRSGTPPYVSADPRSGSLTVAFRGHKGIGRARSRAELFQPLLVTRSGTSLRQCASCSSSSLTLLWFHQEEKLEGRQRVRAGELQGVSPSGTMFQRWLPQFLSPSDSQETRLL